MAIYVQENIARLTAVYIAIRILFELDPALRAVCPPVRVPIRDWLALQFWPHCRVHGIVAEPIGRTRREDGGKIFWFRREDFLCGRRAR